MSNTRKPKILSPEAFEKAVKPLLEQAAAEGYAKGFQDGYHEGELAGRKIDTEPKSRLILPEG